jgi:hypothetical protein
MFIYYVYAYIRSKDSSTAKAGTPYYIGKGKHKRAWSKTHKVNLPKNINNIVILESGLSEIGALALERRYIRWYGLCVLVLWGWGGFVWCCCGWSPYH